MTKRTTKAKLKVTDSLLMPALRCEMGVWRYYVASMRLGDVAERVVFATDLFTSEAYKDLLQRNLDPKRTAEISNYILQNDQRFLGALIVAVKGGDPHWFSIDVDDSPLIARSDVEDDARDRLVSTVGFLQLSGGEGLWALDGQHRLAGIQEALGTPVKEEDRSGEQLPVIFVAHRDDPEGMKRTRRLFTTVNRNAKAINTGERIALDEDDAAAILTRKLVEEHPLLSGDRTAPIKRKSLPATETEAIVAITKIYDICYLLLDKRTLLHQKLSKGSLKNAPRPTDEMIDAMYEVVSGFWTDLASTIPDVGSYLRSSGDLKATPYRGPSGGNLLFRGVGIEAFVYAYLDLSSTKVGRAGAMKMLATVPLELDSELWRGVLWNAEAGKMLALADNRKLATMLLIRQSGGSISEESFKTAYFAIKGEGAEIPAKPKKVNRGKAPDG